jgi:hypothetical protein
MSFPLLSLPFPSLPLPSYAFINWPHLLTHTGNAHTGKDFERAPEHAHDRIDSKDERSLANNIADAERVEKKEKKDEEAHAHEDPTAIARSVSGSAGRREIANHCSTET